MVYGWFVWIFNSGYEAFLWRIGTVLVYIRDRLIIVILVISIIFRKGGIFCDHQYRIRLSIGYAIFIS